MVELIKHEISSFPNQPNIREGEQGGHASWVGKVLGELPEGDRSVLPDESGVYRLGRRRLLPKVSGVDRLGRLMSCTGTLRGRRIAFCPWCGRHECCVTSIQDLLGIVGNEADSIIRNEYFGLV